MIVEIIKIDGENITVKKDGKEKEYEMAEFVIPHAKLGLADIDFNDETKQVRFLRMIDVPSEEKKKSSKRWEDDIVTFEILLTAAHKKAKDSKLQLNIETEVIRDGERNPMINVKEQFAFFKAVVTLEKDGKEIQRFEGHGDSTEKNITGDKIKIHFIRMAETRAIVRALRWYTNNGCAEEEK